MPEPYRLADRATKQLNRQVVSAKDTTKRRLLVAGFDELNVINQVDSLYSTLDRNNRAKMKELFIARYIEMLLYLLATSAVMPSEDIIDEMAELYITKLLDEPNESTHYTYSTEVLRKRDRAKEAIIATPTKTLKQLELDKHIRFWSQMAGWYVDFASQDAEIQAFKDAGIERVVRHEKDDAKTCATCRRLDGRVYDIDKIPPLTHLHCRRWFTAAR